MTFNDCWTYPKKKIDMLVEKLIPNIRGKVTKESTYTISESRVAQKGQVVECHFVCQLDAGIGSSEKKIATISEVALPPTKIRFNAATGTAAYNCKNPCYAILATDGGIAILAGTTTDTVVTIDLVYTID